MAAKLQLSMKRMIYTICFFSLCLIDQRVKTAGGPDGWGETFRNLIGVVMAVLILSHYHPADLKKRRVPCLVWGVICIIGGAAFLIYGQPLAYFLNERIALAAGIFLCGIALILTLAEWFAERKRPRLNVRFACVWLVMLLLMSFSRSGHLWPTAYLVMFGCFYLTDYTQKEREQLFQGMLDGIILGFFLLQGWCFVFRPYDAVRYVGVYTNSNLNALFYLVVLAAALTRLLYVYRLGRSLWLRLYYWVGTGAVLGFLFMTVSRTGWLTGAVLVFTALVFLGRILPRGNFWVSIIKNGLVAVLCFLLLLAPVFCAVRYLPPLFHHPVWFFGEWSEKKVHSWDDWDSEKYVSLDKLMNTAVSRIVKVTEELLDNAPDAAGTAEKTAQEAQAGETALRLEVEGVNMAADGAQADAPQAGGAQADGTQVDVKQTDDTRPDGTGAAQVTPLQQQLYDEALAAGYALRNPSDARKPLILRRTIYRYYAHLLNFRGYPDSEMAFQITPSHNIGHAHNIYLQFGVNYGIPVMLLFILLIIWSAAGFVRRFAREKTERAAGCLLILLVPAVFGLLEYCWGAGSLTVTLLFVVWRGMICDERENRQE